MAFAFDTLGYAKRLRDAGEPEAEAHAEAAREFVMAELATWYDMDVFRRELEQRIDRSVQHSDNAVGSLRQDTNSSMASLRHELALSTQRLESRIDSLKLRLMVRLGGLIAIGIAILAAILKF
jgi:uncharacterized protein Yka (UPF0111/DUF47 family)